MSSSLGHYHGYSTFGSPPLSRFSDQPCLLQWLLASPWSLLRFHLCRLEHKHESPTMRALKQTLSRAWKCVHAVVVSLSLSWSRFGGNFPLAYSLSWYVSKLTPPWTFCCVRGFLHVRRNRGDFGTQLSNHGSFPYLRCHAQLICEHWVHHGVRNRSSNCNFLCS